MPSNVTPPTQLRKDLISMTWPMVFGVLSLMSFQLADSYFVSLLGVEPLAVVGFTIPIYQLVIGLQVGIGIATTALISQRLGASKTEDARLLGGSILFCGTVSVALLCLLIWIFRVPILLALGSDETLLALADRFWAVFLISALVGAILYFGYSICRAHGNTALPGAVMALTSLLNIALDPLYMFYFEFGLPGAAYASLTSFILGCLFVFPRILSMQWISFSRQLNTLIRHLKQISAIAAPAMTSQIMPAFSAMLATFVVASYGTAAVAAWGVGIRVEFFCLVIILALTMSMPPMVGRLFGSNNFASIRRLVNMALKFVIIFQLTMALILAIFSAPLSRIFTNDPEAAPILATFILLVPISYAALGTCMLMVSISNAIGQPNRALIISFIRLFVCYLPFLLLGSMLGGISGLMIGALFGNIAAGLMAWKLYSDGIKKASASLAH